MKLFFLIFVTFPTMFAYAIVYYIKHPNAPDAETNLLLSPLFALMTFLSQYLGIKWINKIKDENFKKELTLGRIGGLVAGFIILIIFFFIV